MTLVANACSFSAVELHERIALATARTSKSLRALSEAAGQSPSWLSNIIQLKRKNADIEALKVVALETGTAIHWLVLGFGSPDDENDEEQRIEPGQRYPNAFTASESLKGLVRPHASARVLSWRLHGPDKPVQWWAERIKEADRELAAEEADPGIVDRQREQAARDTASLKERIDAGRTAAAAKAKRKAMIPKGENDH